MRGRSPQAPVCAHQSVLSVTAVRVCVCVPGICVFNEFEQFLEVLWSSDDDGFRGGDGPSRLVFRLHHTFYKTQPIKLNTEEQGNINSKGYLHKT